MRNLGVNPTAQAFEAELAATPRSAPAGPSIRVQLDPSQCRISAREPADPTAHALPAEVAATPLREPGWGLCICHALPFQWAISV